jgi:hypothetical protein
MSNNNQPKREEDLPRFEPSLSPDNIHNREAAKQRDLTYDPKRQVYIDGEGYLIRDKFGQPL